MKILPCHFSAVACLVGMFCVFACETNDNSGQSDTEDRLVWAKSAGGGDDEAEERVCGISALDDGTMLIAGSYRHEATFGAGEPAETTLVAPFVGSTFIARYAENGELLWAHNAGTSDSEEGGRTIEVVALSPLSDGSVTVTGFFSGTATFGEDQPNETVIESEGDLAETHNAFIAKFDDQGNFLWAESAVGMHRVFAATIGATADDFVVVVGYFAGTATFGKGQSNETTLVLDEDNSRDYGIFMAQYASDGGLSWAKIVAETDRSRPNEIVATGIDIDSDGSLLAIGTFYGKAIFGPNSANEITLLSESESDYDFNSDIFIAKFDILGDPIWAKSAGGESVGEENAESVRDICVQDGGSFFITGTFKYEATFGSGENNETTLRAEEPEEDSTEIYIAKYESNGTLIWANRAGGDKGDYSRGVAALSDGGVVITGSFVDQVTFGYGDPGKTTLNAESSFEGASQDLFIAKYAEDGSFGWARKAGGRHDGPDSYGISTSPDGTVVVTGTFNEIAIFGEGEPNQTRLVSVNSSNGDIFIAKYLP